VTVTLLKEIKVHNFQCGTLWSCYTYWVI